MAQRLIQSKGKGEAASEDQSKSVYSHICQKIPFDLNSILGKLRRRSKNIDWSTVLILYILTSLRGKQASIAMPFLYLMLNVKDDDANGTDSSDTQNSGERIRFQFESDQNKGNEVKLGNRSAIFPQFLDATTTTNTLPTAPPRTSTSQRQTQTTIERRSRSDSVLTQNSETSAASANNQRYVEMLVHNVSHTDMVLSLGIPDSDRKSNSDITSNSNFKDISIRWQKDAELKGTGTKPSESHQYRKNEEAHALCRPRFSAFDMFCRRILSVLHSCLDITERREDQQQAKIQQLLSSIMSFPRYERSDQTPRFSLVTPKKQVLLPVGFNLSQLVKDNEERITKEEKSKLDLSAEDMNSLRVRGKDLVKIETFTSSVFFSTSTPKRKNGNGVEAKDGSIHTRISKEVGDSKPMYLDAIFFPLLCSLLRRWNAQINEKYGVVGKMNVKKVLILVSGVGTPRNWTHSMTGNSTEAVSELMEFFINALYPDVVVVR